MATKDDSNKENNPVPAPASELTPMPPGSRVLMDSHKPITPPDYTHAESGNMPNSTSGGTSSGLLIILGIIVIVAAIAYAVYRLVG